MEKLYDSLSNSFFNSISKYSRRYFASCIAPVILTSSIAAMSSSLYSAEQAQAERVETAKPASLETKVKNEKADKDTAPWEIATVCGVLALIITGKILYDGMKRHEEEDDNGPHS